MEGDDDTWEVQNKKRKGSGLGVGSKSDVSKFFVTNIPQGCRPWDLANAFRPFGEIAGSFIAKKKDKEGRIFGFVSFRGVRDVEDLKSSLSKVKMGGNKLLVNVPLFAKENGNLKPSAPPGGRDKRTGEVHSSSQGVFSKGHGDHHVKKGVSFLDILTNKSHSDGVEDVVVIDPVISSFSSVKEKAVVGRTLGFKELRFLNSSLTSAGFVNAAIQYVGGLSVLISFDNGVDAYRLLEAKDIWKQWFSSLSPWIGQSLPFERITWISVLGVPPHLMSSLVFDEIGSRYGKVIQPSQFVETAGDLSVDRLGILIDSGNKVNGILSLRWQDKKYKVWVVEDNDQWIPDFLDDDDESLAASSKQGEFVDSQAKFDSGNNERLVDGSEFEELGESPVVEVERPKEALESSDVVHAAMQREKEIGGSSSKVCGDRPNYCVGQDPSLNSFVDFNCPQLEEMGPGSELSFKVGKPNCIKSKKFKSISSKGTRPINRSTGSELTAEESRPKKRSRSSMEKRDHISSSAEVNRGDNTETSFDQFCFDLNIVTPLEIHEGIPAAEKTVVEVQKDSGVEVNGGIGKGSSVSSEVEKEVSETVNVGSKIGIVDNSLSELVRNSIITGSRLGVEDFALNELGGGLGKEASQMDRVCGKEYNQMQCEPSIHSDEDQAWKKNRTHENEASASCVVFIFK
ncbi:putative RNA recognition motif domain, nucleotide-binding alpha-beta plait domain superfamily [Helianthus annuus]|nr:putative RNA recognition motif domain, nucleotide-binding alpha-beta plait domain superfamily [Helianthus annuus]